MDEEEVHKFDRDWQGTNNKLGFVEKHKNYIGNGGDFLNKERMIGYGGNLNNGRNP